MGNKLSIGTAQFGLDYGINNSSGKISFKDANEILKSSLSYGIKNIDTAAVYGDSEKMIGKLKEFNSEFNSFRITTKLKYSSTRTLESQISDSKIRLSVSNIDCLLFHSFQDYLLFNLNKKPKYVTKIGVSLHSNEEIEKAINDPLIEVIQAPFNLLDNQSKRGLIFKKIKMKGIEIQVRSIFLQGLIFKNHRDLPLNLIPLVPFLTEIKKIAKKNRISLQQLALSYVLSKTYIDTVLIGVDSLDQLSSNIKSFNNEMNWLAFEEVDSIIVDCPNLLNPVNWKR